MGHPVGQGMVDIQSGRVVFQGWPEIAHFIAAFADHRFVADRVDPAVAAELERPTAFGSEAFQGGGILAVVESGQ